MLAAVYGYALQIYGDFSGYTDIAIGVALLLGFKLPPNFNLPYRANGLQDFWRRWHISLSTWLRDYLYIPLGGSKRRDESSYDTSQTPRVRRVLHSVYAWSGARWFFGLFQIRGGGFFTQRNLFITMLLGGLWHGASWNFVIWGAMHGLGLAIWRGVGALRSMLFGTQSSTEDGPLMHAIRVLCTFHFVIILWVFFRAESFDQAVLVFQQIGSATPGTLHLSREVLVCFLILHSFRSPRRACQDGTAFCPCALGSPKSVDRERALRPEISGSGRAPTVHLLSVLGLFLFRSELFSRRGRSQ